ncbi:thioredoxin reductase [Deferribacterales bacterium RsTz2092]|nr:thioredoxin reductase [Deferribacterales bacterium]
MEHFFDTASIKDDYDVVILGAGPAGCTAALYTSRDELSTLVLERNVPGGQMGITAHIDNHPGVAETITGVALAERYHKQAARFGAIIRYGECQSIVANGKDKILTIAGSDKPVNARAVIIATGCYPRSMGVEGEQRFIGRGVSMCATCDGGFYRDKVVVAVGGGNTALNESIYLTRFAKRVYIVHRRDTFRATKICERAARENPKIELVLDSVVEQVIGTDKVSAALLRNLKTNEMRTIDTDGVFVFIGNVANSKPFEGLLKLDNNGFIITDEHMQTNVSGIFAAGDVRSKEFRQIAIATGEATTAAQAVSAYLQQLSY